MQREIDMREVSDGKFYGLRDMVKAGCDDCKGCSDCCRGMGDSIVLDPYDVYRLTTGLSCSFDELLMDRLALNVVDGLILPNLKMTEAGGHCGFLNKEGRCSIHSLRPGMCRIFPLGRYYENGSFQYFLQVHECRKEPKTKVKVQKWIDTPDVKRNEQFINDWHYFLKDLTEQLEKSENESTRKTVSLYLLKTFYQKSYEKDQDFYEQFQKRLEQARSIFRG